MDYYLHITRAGDWLDSARHPIAVSEWRSFAERTHDSNPTPAAGRSTEYSPVSTVQRRG